MAISVNTDIINILSRRNLSEATNAVSVALERMSTGYKINSAKDNAAGLYIATKLDSQIRGLKQAQKNVADGMSLLQTADGSLKNMASILQRLRDLSVQGANSVYDANSRKAFQDEADALLAELQRLQKNTKFNGLNILGSDIVKNTSTASISTFRGGTTLSVNFAALAAPLQTPLADNLIEGSINFAGGETKTVTIDGVEFIVKNNTSASQSFSYVKDTVSGEIKLNISNFTVRAKSDTEYNLVINGSYNIIHTGEKNDTIGFAGTQSLGNDIYTYGGDDSIVADSGAEIRSGTIDLGAGDDYLEGLINSTIVYGRDGNDTFDINYGCTIYGGEGNDKFYFGSMNRGIYYGDGGEDTFNFTKSNNGDIVIDGGSGTNSVVGNMGSRVIAINVPNANNYAVELAANETKIILINGINYEVTNTKSETNTFIYALNGNTITFNSSNVTIRGEKDKAHDVNITRENITFYGGNLNDKIQMNVSSSYIYAGGGDDEIILNTRYATGVYGEDGNDHIVLKDGVAYGTQVISGGNGDDVFDIYGSTYSVRGDAGNDTFNIYNANNSIISCGDGDDTVNINKAGLTNLNLLGGDGKNVINGTLTDSCISNFEGYDVFTEVKFAKDEEKTIVIGGKTYVVRNRYQYSEENSFQYYYDNVSGKITFSGNGFLINAQSDVSHDVIIDGSYMNFYGGDKDDKIYIKNSSNRAEAGNGDDEITLASNCYSCSIYGQAGNDTLIRESGGANSENHLSGGDGNDEFILDTVQYYDTYDGGNGDDIYRINGTSSGKFSDLYGNNVFYINSDNNTITTGSGNDTFNINGNGNIIAAQGGNDYFEINGSNNNIDGGTETNYSVSISGSNNNVSNLDSNPFAGTLTFEYQGETKEFTIEGKKYTVTNNTNSSSTNPNTLVYNLNPNTGELKLSGSDFTINGDENTQHNILVEGNNNNINTGRLNDKVTINSGSNNVVDTGEGNDNITLNSDNNAVNAGSGDDIITLNASSNLEINAGDGNDRVTANADNNTNIQLGLGNDTAEITGNGNTVNTNEGNNSVTATGDSNNLIGTDGDNILNAIGDNNTISSGTGSNTLGVNGNNNTISSLGNSSTTVVGNQNSFQGGSGIDRVTIRGDENNIKGGESDDNFSVQSGENNFIDGEGGSRNILFDKGENTQYQNIYIPQPLHVRLQVGANAHDSVEFEISFSVEGVILDFSTAESCKENINTIDDLLDSLTTQRSNIGAVMSRLDSIAQNQISKIENYTAAKSTIMDADIAEESANFVKAQILQNTASALISSAQSVHANLVFRLLEGL